MLVLSEKYFRVFYFDLIAAHAAVYEFDNIIFNVTPDEKILHPIIIEDKEAKEKSPQSEHFLDMMKLFETFPGRIWFILRYIADKATFKVQSSSLVFPTPRMIVGKRDYITHSFNYLDILLGEIANILKILILFASPKTASNFIRLLQNYRDIIKTLGQIVFNSKNHLIEAIKHRFTVLKNLSTLEEIEALKSSYENILRLGNDMCIKELFEAIYREKIRGFSSESISLLRKARKLIIVLGINRDIRFFEKHAIPEIREFISSEMPALEEIIVICTVREDSLKPALILIKEMAKGINDKKLHIQCKKIEKKARHEIINEYLKYIEEEISKEANSVILVCREIFKEVAIGIINEFSNYPVLALLSKIGPRAQRKTVPEINVTTEIIWINHV